MISYADGDREAIIIAIGDGKWTVAEYDSFEAFRGRQEPTQVRTFAGTPNRRDMLAAWPGWTPRVRHPDTWALLPESTDDLPELPAVPASVSARQIRIWLVRHGVSLAQVDAAIDAITDPQQREECRIDWEWAPYVERSHPLLLPLAEALGLTPEQVDEAFREAATL